ncbi:hypothetical protein K663_16355 [Sphingobium sp. MI1205]|nr:hypothetical protein [Sphingobium sp. MI1205]AMK19650.1 hypothetical protein K663_16355 [Sphingobium sp. MI1205]
MSKADAISNFLRPCGDRIGYRNMETTCLSIIALPVRTAGNRKMAPQFGVLSGSATLKLGGPDGRQVAAAAGDALLLPALHVGERGFLGGRRLSERAELGKPPTTQSAVRSCLTLRVARSPGR